MDWLRAGKMHGGIAYGLDILQAMYIYSEIIKHLLYI